ncbi:Dynein-like protein [Giardia duodenalis]|uniref:Dynein-like protein n=1 Tax=Giardia intestinalis (strain ATCC 50803 / WB clone C6) TaxID=184922 RepID=A8BXI4_GIAIC|nr:Dynein-like protein [Giardia intestinalis]KAE8302577.1 Dynein-like protein [Giardia intestinalis]|eukprot:XP_001704296.1 Dynein-like protein [Giardia lamblia ATCC 50803]
MQKQKKFQVDVEDPYTLQSELQFPGLVVLEIFAHWCDVCKSIDPIFRNHFVDLATRKLKFVRVQHAFVPWLRRYHGRCRPTFLFFVGGSLKEIVEGIDTPRLDTLIPQLAPENEVPLEKFVPEERFPELNTDEVYLQYLTRVEELERERTIAIEAGTDTDIDPRGEYNSLVKEFESKFQLPMSAYSPGSFSGERPPPVVAKKSTESTTLQATEFVMQQSTEEQKEVIPPEAEPDTSTVQPTQVELDDKPAEQAKDAEDVADSADANAEAEEEGQKPLSDVDEERLRTPESRNSTEDDQHRSAEKNEDGSALDHPDVEGHGDAVRLDREPLKEGQEDSEGAFHYETGASTEDDQDHQQGLDSQRSYEHPAEETPVDQPGTEQGQPDAEQHQEEGTYETEGNTGLPEVDNPPEDAPENEGLEEKEEPARNIESAGTNGTTDVLDFAYTPENVDGDIVDLLETEEANQGQ